MATLAEIRDRVEVFIQDETNVTWATTDIDEAINITLSAYSKVVPQHVIGTVTLAAAGREIDISTLTGLIQVERVWWPYTVAAPEYPPRWRDFEQLSRLLLFIIDPSEPQAADVVRIWYTVAHTLNGLAGATATTLPSEDDSMIVGGAAGACAFMRSQEVSETLTIDGWAPQRLREWGAVQWAKFKKDLDLEARKEATRASGIAQGPPLDRWDSGGSGWN